MRRLLGAGAVFVALAQACSIGTSPRGPLDELTAMATRVETATYAAVYRFAYVEQFEGQSTRLQITQQPPVTVRRMETSTTPADGKPVTVTSWHITRADGDFVCTSYEKIGVRCQKRPIATSTFGTAKLDVFFDTPRQSDAFASVRKAARPVRIQEQQGICFEAVPVQPSPPLPSPEPTSVRFRYELCYADDGILLRGRRSTLEDTGGARQSESFVEAVEVSRVVEPAELKMPGPIADVDDLS